MICYENVVEVGFFFFFNKIFDGFVLLMSVIASVYNNLQILVSKVLSCQFYQPIGSLKC